MAEDESAKPRRSLRTTIRKRWRAWLRAFHRDIGYLVVGLTFVYALSGLAINHVGEWDPNFKSVVSVSKVEAPIPEDTEELTDLLLARLGQKRIDLNAAFWDSDTVFELSLAEGVARFDTTTSEIRLAEKEPRFFLRVANWLHYNRGKSTWTYVADAYAVLLLYLACSGLFMLRGKKGLYGRGGILVILGVAVPILYVHFSGGP